LPGSNFLAFYDGSNPNNPEPPNGNSFYDNGHGTACAGIIAATQNNGIGISGVAPNCKIMPVRNSGLTNIPVSDIARSVWFADSNGAKVLSCSWGFPSSDPNFIPSIVTAIRNAINHGKIVIFAAGNQTDRVNNNYVMFPANAGVKGMLTVGASDRYDTVTQSFTGRFTGTSAATPMVAGTAALMLSVNSCLSPASVKDILEQTADKPGGYNYQYNSFKKGHSKELGYGRINAWQAVKAAQEMKKTTLDLYIKDSPKDLGVNSYYANDNSPDI
jgi:subtilisin family serine protease